MLDRMPMLSLLSRFYRSRAYPAATPGQTTRFFAIAIGAGLMSACSDQLGVVAFSLVLNSRVALRRTKSMKSAPQIKARLLR
jgi:hypothetical protein